MGEAPSLWTWVYLAVVRRNLGRMVEVLGSRRMQAATRLVIRAVSPTLLNAVLHHPTLTDIDIRFVILSLEEPELLAKAITKLQGKLGIFERSLTCPQAEAIFATISAGCHLARLSIGCVNLSSVNPSLLAGAVAGLEEVRLYLATLTTHQLDTILTTIAKPCRLRRLSVMSVDLSSVNSALLARVVNKLEEVDMYGTSLSVSQVEEVLLRSQVAQNKSSPTLITCLQASPKWSLVVSVMKDNLRLNRPFWTETTYNLKKVLTDFS